MIDPDANVYLKWTTQKDRQDIFSENAVRVISGPDSLCLNRASRRFGIYRMDPDGRIVNMAAPIIDWGQYYSLLVQSVIDGTWAHSPKDKALNYWWGMQAGVVDMLLSERIPYATRKLVSGMKEAIKHNHFTPFAGRLAAQTGVVLADERAALSSRQIITMNWLNENIIGTIPNFDSLDEHVKPTVTISGLPNI